MLSTTSLGQIVILNGTPRSGESSSATVTEYVWWCLDESRAQSVQENDPRSLSVWFVGIRCPLEVIMERRLAAWTADGSLPKLVSLWQQSVHVPGVYDLEVDASVLSSEECADLIRKRLQHGPSPIAFQRVENMVPEKE